MSRTTISMSHKTKNKLAECGVFGETYDDIIIKLIDKYQLRSKK